MSNPSGSEGLYVGERSDDSGARTGERALVDADDLTTHGVIVGMTGSGKTGLAISLIEEVLLSGVPVLAIDPKGDLADLLLTFPELRPDDFAPWVPDGDDPSQVATTWREGLADWGVGPERIAALRSRVRMGVYTPGSTAATPLDVVGSLGAPAGSGGTPAEAEAVEAEVQAITSGLLGLVGIEGDPLASPEHLLVANLVHAAWSAGESLDLATLLQRIQDPPMRRLGVMELDTVIGPDARTKLAVRLNGILAAPGFQDWFGGAPLDPQRLLFADDGRPSLAVIALSHLSDAERQLVVSRVLASVIRWFRSQPGTDRLRALVYLDEVAGYAPPTAQPATKAPILTILKQARAFGVGMVLATQNPVDLDYKAMSNAGTWMVGRLQTERDKARLLEGMAPAAGGVDVAALDASITALDKRQFLWHRTGSDVPVRFGSRWAMSYLRGPVTGSQLAQLPGREEVPPATAAAATAAPAPGSAAAGAVPAAAPAPAPGVDAPVAATTPPGVDGPGTAAGDASPVMPEVADGVPVRYLDPAAPWAAAVGAVPTSTALQAGIALRVSLLFDDAKAGVREVQEWEAVLAPLGDVVDPATATVVDHDDRDLRPDAPAAATYLPTPARIGTKSFYTDLSKRLKDLLVREQVLTVPVNRTLKLWGRVGETAEEFAARCDEAAQAAADAEAAKVREKLTARIERSRAAVETARRRADSAAEAADAAGSTELTDVAGSLLGGLLGGRSRTRGLATAARTAMAGRERVGKARQRADDAAAAVADKADDVAALEQELAEQLVAIDDEWRAVADEVQEAQITLSRTDVTVEMVTLVWIPV
ncbi:ATP-binding protein [Dermatobacter hominis]|uniref:ATP-binding protein n=1 Tax=Dermatobacter hominis TaxID=2884263 RepID=UPI001D0F5CBD|nr:ATP-binding protein [Dermatobacter hominis]UDY37109.1 ATP-binding protein [Dermatobacter hominis]